MTEAMTSEAVSTVLLALEEISLACDCEGCDLLAKWAVILPTCHHKPLCCDNHKILDQTRVQNSLAAGTSCWCMYCMALIPDPASIRWDPL